MFTYTLYLMTFWVNPWQKLTKTYVTAVFYYIVDQYYKLDQGDNRFILELYLQMTLWVCYNKVCTSAIKWYHQ